MISDLTGKISEHMAKEWAGRDLAPALLFYVSAIILFAGMSPTQWYQSLAALPPTTGLVITILGIAVLAATSFVINELVFPALRLLEGYWPQWPGVRQLRRALVNLQRSQKARLHRDADDCSSIASGQDDPGENADAIAIASRAESRLRDYPADEAALMPTRIGNIIRAGERHSESRYGIDMPTTWMHLLQLLPDRSLETVTLARRELNRKVAGELWALLFVCLSPFQPWCLLGLPVLLFAHFSVRGAARHYAQMIRICYDLHRNLLYKAVGHAIPPAQSEDASSGKALTRWIQRGMID